MGLLESKRKELLKILFNSLTLFTVVAGAVVMGLHFAVAPYYVPALWPSFGLATGFLLIYGLPYAILVLPAFFLGFYLHDFSTVELMYPTCQIALGMSLFGAIQVVLRYFLIRYFIKQHGFLRIPAAIAKLLFILLGVTVVTFLTLILLTQGYGKFSLESTRYILLGWAGADLVGSLVCIPLIVSFGSSYQKRNSSGGFVEYVLFVLAISSMFGIAIFLPNHYAKQFSYILLPFFFWVAFRYSLRDTTISLAVFALLIALSTSRSISDLVGVGFFNSVYFLQLYLFVTVPIILLISALSTELRKQGVHKQNWVQPRQEKDINAVTQSNKIPETQPEILRLAIDHSPGTVLVTDVKGKIVFANNAFTRITGYSVEEVMGQKPSILKSGYHSTTFYENLWNTISNGNTWDGVFYNVKKDGSKYWEEATIAPVWHEGKITHYICTKQDITHRKNVIDALKSSEEQFRILAENSPIHILKINEDGKITYANKDVFEIAVKDLLDKTIYSFFDSRYHSIACENIALTFKGKISTSFEATILHPDKKNHYYDIITAPIIKDEQVPETIIILQDITQSVLYRDAVRESGKKYRLLAENVGDVIWVMNSNLKYTFVSPSVLEITGYTVEDVEKMTDSMSLVSFPEHIIKDIKELTRINGKKEEVLKDNKWEAQVLRKDGVQIWLESKIKPVYSSTGDFDGLIGISRDVTFRKESEELLRQSEAKFRTFFQDTHVIMLMIEPDQNTIEAANHAALDFYGYTSEELSAMNFSDIDITENGHESRHLASITGNRHVPVIMQHRLKNGSIKDVEVYPTLVKIAGRNVLFTIIQDVTRRKKAVDALKKSESKKLALLKIIPDLIFVINRKSVILDVYTDDPAKLYLPPHELMGKKFIKRMPKKHQKQFKDAINEAFESRGVVTFDYSYQSKGEMVFEEVRFIVSGADELVIIIRDISTLKRNEKELKRAWQEAEKANTAKSAFLANMSHEIRTPINAVLGFTEILTKELKNPQYKDYLSSIKSSSKTLLSLINDILDLSKIEAGELSLKPEYISLSTLVNEMKDVFWLKMTQKGLSFKIDLDKMLPESLFMDELRMRQILLNLLGNAHKFTEQGGIHLSIQLIGSTRIDNSSFVTIKIMVADTGIGIAENARQSIFDAFKQQEDQDSRKYGGTGLGLAITRRMVELMDGEIKVESKLGEGSTFIIEIPHILVGEVSAPQVSPVLSKTTKVRFKDARILIVDDVEINRELLRGIIKGNDLQFFEAHDGVNALEVLEEIHPDVMLLDLNMPKMNGFEVTEIIRKDERLKELPIIAISATRIARKEEEKAKMFDVFIAKPFKVVDLVEVLKRFLPYDEFEDGAVASAVQQHLFDPTKFSPDALTILEREMLELHEAHGAIKESSSFDEIGEFAVRVLEMQDRYDIPELYTLASRIQHAVEGFDIEEINKTTVELPEVLQRILDLTKKQRANG